MYQFQFLCCLVFSVLPAIAHAAEKPYFGPEFECPDPCILEMNTLKVDYTLQGPDTSARDVSFSTRVFGTRTSDTFQGSLPGPTMRFKSGETKHVTVVNNLSPLNNGVTDPYDAVNSNFNEGNTPNTTNIHTV